MCETEGASLLRHGLLLTPYLKPRLGARRVGNLVRYAPNLPVLVLA